MEKYLNKEIDDEKGLKLIDGKYFFDGKEISEAQAIRIDRRIADEINPFNAIMQVLCTVQKKVCDVFNYPRSLLAVGLKNLDARLLENQRKDHIKRAREVLSELNGEFENIDEMNDDFKKLLSGIYDEFPGFPFDHGDYEGSRKEIDISFGDDIFTLEGLSAKTGENTILNIGFEEMIQIAFFSLCVKGGRNKDFIEGFGELIYSLGRFR